jgi:hypothetical protein
LALGVPRQKTTTRYFVGMKRRTALRELATSFRVLRLDAPFAVLHELQEALSYAEACFQPTATPTK